MLGRFLLARPHVGVQSVLGQKVAMPATFHDTALVQDQNFVGIDDGR